MYFERILFCMEWSKCCRDRDRLNCLLVPIWYSAFVPWGLIPWLILAFHDCIFLHTIRSKCRRRNPHNLGGTYEC
jgi:hypothetical protein